MFSNKGMANISYEYAYKSKPTEVNELELHEQE